MLGYLFRNKIHLSALSTLGAAAWSVFFGIPVLWQALLIVFLVTFSIYQYNRLTDEIEDTINQPENLQAAQRHGFLITYIFFYLISLFCLVLAASVSWQAFCVTLFLELVGFVYNQKCFPDWLAHRLGGARRLKDLYIIKNLAPPVDWATAMIFLPLIFVGEPLSLQAWICWGYIFTCAFFIEVMWDIRDRHGDLISGIKTIANTLSLYRTKAFLVVSSSLSGLGLFLATYFGILPSVSYFLLSNNLAVMVIASSYHDDLPDAGRWLSDMTIMLALLLFTSFAALAYFVR
ncbi:MAG: UbiA family prenyltransferase [Candidatus Thermochlorobacter sp.]